MERLEIVNLAYRSVKWSALSSLLPRLVTPVATMVLAGLLTPNDFGIVAAAMLIVTLSQVLVGIGMGTAVIQRETHVEQAASLAFGISLGMATLVYGLLWFLSPTFASLYQIPALISVIRVTGLSLFLSALASIPMALMQRNLEFRRLFWVGSAPQIVTAIVSVIAAFLGAGYWALVLGQLTGMAVNVVLVWRSSQWRPRLVFESTLVRSLFGFGLWVMLSSFQTWLFLSGDNAIAGYYFGAQGLGIYALGFNIAMLLPAMIVATLSGVAYPAFCALQRDGPRAVGLSLLKVQTTAAMALAPICFGFSAIAVPLVSLLYGDKWPGLGLVIQWLVILPGVVNLWSLNADAYRSINHPEAWTKVAAASLLILMPLLVIAGTYGMDMFVAARFVGALTLPLFNILAARRILHISIVEQIKSLSAPLSLSVFMYGIALALVYGLSPFEGILGWAKLAGIVFIGILVYGGSLGLIRPDLYRQLLGSVRRVVLPA